MKNKIMLAILATLPIAAQSYDIKSYCQQVSESVGGSYRIEASCQDGERASQANIANMTVPERIEKYCQEVGQSIGGSYRIMESCIKNEIEAKNKLQ
jgi:hypothetical protein